MAYTQLKEAIKSAIKRNGNNEITGDILQQILLQMVIQLPQADFVGVATPTTNPGTPDGGKVYLAGEQGTYTNFGNIVVGANQLAVIRGSESTWEASYITLQIPEGGGSGGYINCHDYQDTFAPFNDIQQAFEIVPKDKFVAGTTFIYNLKDGNWYTALQNDTNAFTSGGLINMYAFIISIVGGTNRDYLTFPCIVTPGEDADHPYDQIYARYNSTFARDLPAYGGTFAGKYISDIVSEVEVYGYNGTLDVNVPKDVSIVHIVRDENDNMLLQLNYTDVTGDRVTIDFVNFDILTHTFYRVFANFIMKIKLKFMLERSNYVDFDDYANILSNVPSGFRYYGMVPKNPFVADTADASNKRTSDIVKAIRVFATKDMAQIQWYKSFANPTLVNYDKLNDKIYLKITINGVDQTVGCTAQIPNNPTLFRGMLPIPNNTALEIQIFTENLPARSYTFPNNQINVAIFEAATKMPIVYKVSGTPGFEIGNQIVTGYLNETTGTITPYADNPTQTSIVSDFVRIEDWRFQQGYKMFLYQTETYCFYSEATEASFIKGYRVQDWSTIAVTPPIEANFVRASGHDYFNEIVQFVEDRADLNKWYFRNMTIEPNQENSIAGVRKFNTLGYQPYTMVLVTEADVTAGNQYILPGNGQLENSAGTYKTTLRYIPINFGGNLSMRAVRSYAFYDNNKAYLAGWENVSKDTNSVVRVPAGTRYMRVSMYNDFADEDETAYVIRGNEPPQYGKYQLINVVQNNTADRGIFPIKSGAAYRAIKSIMPNANPKGEVFQYTYPPEPPEIQYDDAYLVSDDQGDVFDIGANMGDIVTFDGEWKRVVPAPFLTSSPLATTYDVVIIGSGVAGMGVAMGFAGEEYSTLLVEELSSLGGTASNGLVQRWSEGCPPFFFEELFTKLKNAGNAVGNLENFYLPSRFSNGAAESLTIKPTQLVAACRSMFDSSVTSMVGTKFLSVNEVDNGMVKSIYVKAADGSIKLIKGKYFIDATGSGALCRSINGTPQKDYFYGQDDKNYNESLAPVVPSKLILDAPALMFLITPNYDDSSILSKIVSVYRSGNTVVKPDYIGLDGYTQPYIGTNELWVDPGAGMMMTGGYINIMTSPKVLSNEFYKLQMLEYWKYIKLTLQIEFELHGDNYPVGNFNTNMRNYGFAYTAASLIGIRNGFRINCERMLTQPMLTQRISSSNLQDYIAYGCQDVHFNIKQGYSQMAIDNFNVNQLRPYGIPYECIVPRGLKNVLVPGRAFGATQIALSSANTNILMMQLGCAAGSAIKTANLNYKSTLHDLDVSDIQSNMQFKQTVQKMESKLKSGI